jgi:hypothetical protein
MPPRQLAIVAVAVVVAFGAAFGIGKATGGSKDAAATPAKPAQSLQVGGATVAAGVSAAGALPALQVPRKKKAKKPSTGSSPASNAAAPAPTTTTSAPSARTVTPAPSTRARTTNPAPASNNPIRSGGGEG